MKESIELKLQDKILSTLNTNPKAQHQRQNNRDVFDALEGLKRYYETLEAKEKYLWLKDQRNKKTSLKEPNQCEEKE